MPPVLFPSFEQVTDLTDDFIANFALVCNTDYKSELSGSLHHNYIRDILSKVDLEQVLGNNAAYSTFKTAYGFKTWLTAPEEGVRGLLREAIQLHTPPLHGVLDEVHKTLVRAVNLSMKRTGRRRKMSKDSGGRFFDDSMNHLLLDQALNVVGEWRDQTWDQISRNLHAEAEFPAPERFAILKARLQQLLGAAATKRAARLAAEHKRQLAASLGYSLDALPEPAGTNAAPKIPPTDVSSFTSAAAPAAAVQDDIPSWSEFYMGWLDKKSRRGVWQRRWFALSVRQQRLWYFGHPEEQPARGTVDLKGAMVLADEDGGQLAFRLVMPNAFAAAAEGDQLHVHENGKAAFTGSRTKTQALAMAMRAGSAASRQEWLDMLNKTVKGVPIRPEVQVPTLLPSPVDLEEGGSGVERKISTKVFSEKPSISATTGTGAGTNAVDIVAEASTPKVERKPTKPSPSRLEHIGKDDKAGLRASPSSESEIENEYINSDDYHDVENNEGNEEVEEDEAARVETELRLFEEISLQAQEDEPTEEEWAVLHCVCKAVREYVEDAQIQLTEQASKIIADGMLPGSRVDELHAALLKVLAGGGGDSD